MQTEPMTMDDIEPEMPAKDADGIPYCRKHHCRMEQASGGKKNSPTAYYRCKVADCKEKAQKVKTPNPAVVPAQPIACPRCSKSNKPVHCERDPKASTAAMVILKCPACGWKSSGLVVPQLAAAHFARRGPVIPIANIGDR